ncbi:hypothetical protein MRB53_009833 [Persea americana]|uniref:Uncharacterized protein n=1 Tax=Persea americana TaxID=3435 RepID=A0ACC2LQ74_PERAE|nr:hypothetical protein MRB53_009833 [Persea americana]
MRKARREIDQVGKFLDGQVSQEGKPVRKCQGAGAADASRPSSHPVALLIRPDAGASHTTVDPIPFEDSLSPSASSVELHNPFSVLEKVAQEAPSTPSDTLVSHPFNSSPQNPLSNCFRPDISKNLSIDFCIQEEPPSPTNKSTNQATRAAPLTLIWSPSSANLATAVQPTTKKKKHERKKKSRTIEVTPP